MELNYPEKGGGETGGQNILILLAPSTLTHKLSSYIESHLVHF